MTKIVICGACGKMGKMISKIALKDKDVEIVGAVDIKSNPLLGKDLGEILETKNIGVKITSDLEAAVKTADCVIDFTLPEGVLEHVKVCEKNNVPMVIGITGMDASLEKVVCESAKKIPIVYSPNMSRGVNLVFKLVSEAAKILGKEYDIRGDETHHIHKKDAPSGTAKMLSKVIKEACGKDVEFQSFREGEVVGNHGVVFENQFETIEIRHDAKTREVFASGAVTAAKFVVGKKPGAYKMFDVFGL